MDFKHKGNIIITEGKLATQTSSVGQLKVTSIYLGTSYNPTGQTITSENNYIRYNLTAQTAVILPSADESTPQPQEGQVLNIIKFGIPKLRLRAISENSIQGPIGQGSSSIGNTLDLPSGTITLSLIYDSDLSSWVVMSCSNYTNISYLNT